jgi:hypothetical protein
MVSHPQRQKSSKVTYLILVLLLYESMMMMVGCISLTTCMGLTNAIQLAINYALSLKHIFAANACKILVTFMHTRVNT